MSDQKIKDDKRPCAEFLKVELTDAEILALGKDQGRALLDKSHLEDQLKEFKDSIKGKISTKETTIKHCSNLITQGYEFRNVECEWRFDWDANVKELFRLDNGEQVTMAEITKEDRQSTMEIAS